VVPEPTRTEPERVDWYRTVPVTLQSSTPAVIVPEELRVSEPTVEIMSLLESLPERVKA
jgi:hypothetical protein